MFTKKQQTLSFNSSSITFSVIPWDSLYLQNTTVEIEHIDTQSIKEFQKLFKKMQENLQLKRGDLVFCKLSPEHFSQIPLLSKMNFYWIEQSVTLKINISTWKPENFIYNDDHDYTFIIASAKDKPCIRNIAQNTFIADRYHADLNIPKERANYRFEMWIENSFTSSDIIYKFVNKDNDIVGFFIISEIGEKVELRLAGLDPRFIGKGMGKMLYHHMYKMLKEKGFKESEAIISLNNIPVLNVYMYLGNAKFLYPYYVFHHIIQ